MIIMTFDLDIDEIECSEKIDTPPSKKKKRK